MKLFAVLLLLALASSAAAQVHPVKSFSFQDGNCNRGNSHCDWIVGQWEGYVTSHAASYNFLSNSYGSLIPFYNTPWAQQASDLYCTDRPYEIPYECTFGYSEEDDNLYQYCWFSPVTVDLCGGEYYGSSFGTPGYFMTNLIESLENGIHFQNLETTLEGCLPYDIANEDLIIGNLWDGFSTISSCPDPSNPRSGGISPVLPASCTVSDTTHHTSPPSTTSVVTQTTATGSSGTVATTSTASSVTSTTDTATTDTTTDTATTDTTTDTATTDTTTDTATTDTTTDTATTDTTTDTATTDTTTDTATTDTTTDTATTDTTTDTATTDTTTDTATTDTTTDTSTTDTTTDTSTTDTTTDTATTDTTTDTATTDTTTDTATTDTTTDTATTDTTTDTATTDTTTDTATTDTTTDTATTDTTTDTATTDTTTDTATTDTTTDTATTDTTTDTVAPTTTAATVPTTPIVTTTTRSTASFTTQTTNPAADYGCSSLTDGSEAVYAFKLARVRPASFPYNVVTKKNDDCTGTGRNQRNCPCVRSSSSCNWLVGRWNGVLYAKGYNTEWGLNDDDLAFPFPPEEENVRCQSSESATPFRCSYYFNEESDYLNSHCWYSESEIFPNRGESQTTFAWEQWQEISSINGGFNIRDTSSESFGGSSGSCVPFDRFDSDTFIAQFPDGFSSNPSCSSSPSTVFECANGGVTTGNNNMFTLNYRAPDATWHDWDASSMLSPLVAVALLFASLLAFF